MPGYPHLTRSERDQIAELKAQGLGPTAIGQAIGRDKSTISRELRRNAHADGTYRPVYAEGSYLYRRQRKAVLEQDDRLKRFVLIKDAFAMATYFCDAYASWQKGGIENMNGRIRRWFPRSTDLDELTDEDIQDVAMTLNLTPRKCLGFKTPAEAFLDALGKSLTIRFNEPVALRA